MLWAEWRMMLASLGNLSSNVTYSRNAFLSYRIKIGKSCRRLVPRDGRSGDDKNLVTHIDAPRRVITILPLSGALSRSILALTKELFDKRSQFAFINAGRDCEGHRRRYREHRGTDSLRGPDRIWSDPIRESQGIGSDRPVCRLWAAAVDDRFHFSPHFINARACPCNANSCGDRQTGKIKKQKEKRDIARREGIC